jgi:carbamoyl-phosphate synthase large subunit
LSDATEVDVDVVADFVPGEANDFAADQSGRKAVVCGVMEHIEQAGIHSGDSACTIPPWSLPKELVERIRTIGRDLARELRVNGLMNVQMAIKDGEIYILEVNPRASRTAPFVGKATHVQWPRIAAKVMMGKTLSALGAKEVDRIGAYAVKESVFPFSKFPGVDVVLGPEMRSTGEVMGIDASFPIAFAKSQFGAGIQLPLEGTVFLSVRKNDREQVVGLARDLIAMGFGVVTSPGMGEFLSQRGVPTQVIQKVDAGLRPNVLDLMSDGKIQLIINTPTRTGWKTDEGKIRSAAVRLGIAMITTITGAIAAVKSIRALREHDWGVAAMQDFRALAGAPVNSAAASACTPTTPTTPTTVPT